MLNEAFGQCKIIDMIHAHPVIANSEQGPKGVAEMETLVLRYPDFEPLEYPR